MAFRRLWPEDAGRLAAHMRRLDDESRRFRFGRAVSDEFLDRYCAETDWLHSILIGYEPDGELRGVGELRRLPGPEFRTGEFALSVERPWRGQGVGTELLRRLIALARHRGVDVVYMLCLAENRAMQRIASKLQAEVSWAWGQTEARIQLRAPSLVSHVTDTLESLALALGGAAAAIGGPRPSRAMGARLSAT